MNALIARLTASAKALNIQVLSDEFDEALAVATLAFEDGRGLDSSFEIGRSVLVRASTSGRSVSVLTAA